MLLWNCWVCSGKLVKYNLKLSNGSENKKCGNSEEPALNFSSEDEMVMDDSEEHEDYGEGEVSD